MDNKPIEVMAPAGSFSALHAAIEAGADAVYFGIGSLNMRAQAAMNFTEEDLPQITSLCKERHIKTYLTVNTVVYDHEIEQIDRILQLAKQAHITAIIASDLAVITLASELGLEIHISTQCNITNLEAVRFYARFADVMVASRELSLDQITYIIKQIREQNICGPKGELVQIEVFAHGALCMAVSGKCYLSLDHYARSANRGACLQLCRRPYLLSEIPDAPTKLSANSASPANSANSANSVPTPSTESNRPPVEIAVSNQYLLSPKDLKTVDFLDRLLSTGVSVLKIEGRGRTADYVKTVTRVYKEAVQSWQDGSYTAEKIEDWNTRLKHVYNRGFWEGYYMGKTTGEWTQQYGSLADRRKTYIGKVTNYFSHLKVAEIKIECESLSIGDPIVVIGHTTGAYEDQIREIRVNLKSVKKAHQGEYGSIPTLELLRRGDKLYRVDTLETQI